MRSAEQLFASIGTGITGAIHRPNNTTQDRVLRSYIEHANLNGDLIIPTGERQYYRPDMSKESDRCVTLGYIAKERARINSMITKLEEMTKTYKELASQYTDG